MAPCMSVDRAGESMPMEYTKLVTIGLHSDAYEAFKRVVLVLVWVGGERA